MPSGIASSRPAITAMATSSRVRVAPWASLGSHLMITAQFRPRSKCAQPAVVAVHWVLLAKPRAGAFFQEVHAGHGQHGEAQVHERRHHEEGERLLGHGHADLRVAHDFFEADHRYQRGVLHQDHEQVAQARQGDAPHLRHDQAGEDAKLRQAQCHTGFTVALGNGEDRATEHFRWRRRQSTGPGR